MASESMAGTMCVVCSIETSKYRCPKCLQRYCSVSCCKLHKVECDPDSDKPVSEEKPVSLELDSNNVPAPQRVAHGFAANSDDDDRVPDSLLQQLGESSDVKECLRNAHLRAMLENLLNSDTKDRAMAAAMQEPIFTQFADACLKVVDRNNPNLEPEDL